MRHIHHIIPKHAGGTDDPSNLVSLTLEEHAEAHRLLYEKYGRIEDKVAWKALSNNKEEFESARRELASKVMKKYWIDNREEILKKTREAREARINSPGYVNPLKGKTLKDPGHHKERLLKQSESARRQHKEGRSHCVGDVVRGTNFSQSHRESLSKKAKGRSRMTCKFCGKDSTPQMHSRWHGENCKSAPKMGASSLFSHLVVSQ